MPKPLLQPMAISGDVRFFRRKPPDVTEPDAQTRNILVPFNRVLDQFHSEWSALMGFTRRLCNCASCTALLSRKNPSAVKEGSKNPISAGIRDQGETRRVRFRKTVAREGSNLRDDLFLSSGTEAVFGHATPQLGFDFFHTFFRAFEAHRSAQFFRFTTCKVRSHHCDAQQLFVKQWHSQSSLQSR